MSRGRDYQYSSAATSSHGLMRCAVCTKSITEGQYRYHDTPNAYVTVHRGCCADDAEWKKFDAEQKSQDVRHASLLADAIAFRTKWRVTDLDELIHDLNGSFQRRKA